MLICDYENKLMNSCTIYAQPNISPNLLSHIGAVVQLPSSILELVGSSPNLRKLFFQFDRFFRISRYFSYFCRKLLYIHILILASDGNNYIKYYLTFPITLQNI